MPGCQGRSERQLAALAPLIRRFAPPSPAGGRRVGVARFCPRPPHRREWRARPRLWLPYPGATAARGPASGPPRQVGRTASREGGGPDVLTTVGPETITKK